MANETTAITAREMARQNVKDNVYDAARNSHERNYKKLHIMRDGSVSWFESINQSDDIIDRYAKRFAAIPSVITVGTGSCACNCDYCRDEGYATTDDAIDDAVSDSDLSWTEDAMLVALDEIPDGYFDDETSDDEL